MTQAHQMLLAYGFIIMMFCSFWAGMAFQSGNLKAVKAAIPKLAAAVVVMVAIAFVGTAIATNM